MEINLKQFNQQEIENTTTSKKMRLSENAQSMVFQLFTKSIYSNPIGTVVREITSNCFDSHVEAKVKTPVYIKKFTDNQTNTIYISFIDNGVGMSPDRIENIYGVYFESTKRSDNTQIGGFGIGGKTPLAYKRSTGFGEGEYDNSFYVITRYNGVKYSYCIYEGSESPVISLLHQENTSEGNGTEVRIPVLAKDVSAFQNEMTRQLYYFENIIFEGFDNDEFLNNFQIIKGKSFLFRGSDYSSYAHVCLGKVAYPIDYNVLGLSSTDYAFPVAVKLEVGDISVIANREQLDYSENSIKVLKAKLQEVKKELIDLLVKQYDAIVILKDYFNMKTSFGKLYFPNKSSFNMSNVIAQKDVSLVNFKYSFMNMPTDKQLFKFFFDVKLYGKKPTSKGYTNSFSGGYDTLLGKRSDVLYVEDEFNRKVVKQAYMAYKYKTFYIITKRNVAGRFMREEISELFNVHLDSMYDDNNKPVVYVQSLQELQEEYFDIVRENQQDYDELIVPEDFIMSRKNNKAKFSTTVRDKSIPVKLMSTYGKDNVRLGSLFDYNMPIFYGTQDDEMALKNAYQVFQKVFRVDDNSIDYRHNIEKNGNKKGIMFMMLSKTNVKYMQYCKKAYHVSNFYNKMLYRKVDDIKDFFKTYSVLKSFELLPKLFRSNLFEKISPEWGAKIIEINNAIESIKNNASYSSVEYEIKRFINLDNFKLSEKEIEIIKLVDDIKFLSEMNSEVLTYINMPHYIEGINDSLIQLLKKVLVL